MAKQTAHIEELQRLLRYCDKCKAAPAEECSEICSRDGSRHR